MCVFFVVVKYDLILEQLQQLLQKYFVQLLFQHGAMNCIFREEQCMQYTLFIDCINFEMFLKTEQFVHSKLNKT